MTEFPQFVPDISIKNRFNGREENTKVAFVSADGKKTIEYVMISGCGIPRICLTKGTGPFKFFDVIKDSEFDELWTAIEKLSEKQMEAKI